VFVTHVVAMNLLTISAKQEAQHERCEVATQIPTMSLECIFCVFVNRSSAGIIA